MTTAGSRGGTRLELRSAWIIQLHSVQSSTSAPVSTSACGRLVKLDFGERRAAMNRRSATLEHYKAGMLLSGVGDALGYRNQLWEYNESGPVIHQELKELGGLKNIKAELPDWPVSDDTVLHLATAEGLATGVSQLKPGEEGGYRVAYNPEGTGCGAAMRSMCIGLRYPKPDQLLSLVAVAVETGRMTHPHPTGFLGAVASALFTAYAIQRRPITTYLDLRGISNGIGPPVFPSSYGPAERDEAYKSFSLSGWAGRSGHDAPMIALDALLGAGSDWEELMSRAGFHGGDSDSTAVIAACCWGLLYGTQGVPEGNYSNLEYRERLERSAEQLYALSH
ncbi:[Protein ADP-ribosylarginine] hydrolase [Collichthys lucidus]|uniref:[Protein ADP-ribosylarginine] hydrolase n=1 Tax=Collichthys lucidus TaxID=240159 RepID=A0A4U5VN52_COLLU|nr:[Protein ADP-ribosylarginine] hydrolase [Collichthys lucidus]